MRSRAQILRDYLNRDTIVTAVGCYDGFTAKLVEQAGFEVALISGAGVATSLQGLPDNGLLTLTEMADAAKRISNSVSIPVIADGDNGYENALNARRAVIEFELGGCAAIQLEDQKSPKSCGHMEGKEVVPCLEHCRKIELAAETRRDMLILARTDAASVNGIDDAIMRVNEYAKAGADFVIVDAPRTVEEIKKIGEQVTAPVMINLVEGGKTPYLSKDALQQMGFRLVCYPGVCTLSVIHTLQMILQELKATGSTQKYKDLIGVLKDHNELVNDAYYRALERKYIHGLSLPDEEGVANHG